MPFDLQNAEVVVTITTGVLTIFGIIFGWIGKILCWVSSTFKLKSLVGDIPSRTMILIPVANQNSLWWHMGAVGDQPAMQIVGDLNITNVSKGDVFVMGAKLKKPKAIGHAMVRAQGSNSYGSKNIIPEGGVSDLRFDFFVQPPVSELNQSFKADVAIIDQFGNEHWLKGLEFPYL